MATIQPQTPVTLSQEWGVSFSDYKVNGIGSNSCGPRLKKEYRFDEEKFSFALRLELIGE